MKSGKGKKQKPLSEQKAPKTTAHAKKGRPSVKEKKQKKSPIPGSPM